MQATHIFKYLCCFILILILAACGEEEKIENLPRPVSTMIVEAEKSYYERTISGIVQPVDTAELSFEVTGKVDAVLVELGERFKKNDVLAQLEQINYELAVKEREGQLSETKARLLEAERDFNRKADLVKDGAVSKAEFDLAKSQFESAKDQVKIAEARLGMAQEDLDDTALIAPYDGTIAARYIEPSQRISPNEPAFMIQGNDGLEVRVFVPETMLAQLEVEQAARVKISALKQILDAQITEIGTAAEEANSFPVILTLSQQNISGLKPGMSAEALFNLNKALNETQGFVLPVSAFLADENNSHFVYKIVSKPTANDGGEGNKDATYAVQKVPVTVLDLFEQQGVVQGDLTPGERVVKNGMAFLKDGQAVSIIEEGVEHYNP